MAWGNSGLYLINWIHHLSSTYTNRYVIDLSSTNNRVALYNNSVTPNYSHTDGTTAGSLVVYTTANEASTTTNGYTAGGMQPATPVYTDSPAGTLKYSHDALTWTASTISAYGGLWYGSAVTAGDTGGLAKPSFVAVSFGQTYSSTNGNFVVTPHANGVFTVDLTP